MILYFILTFFILATACEKKVDLADSYAYAQTQCADKWASGSTTTETVHNLKQYLAGKGIEVAEATLTNPPTDRFYCLACTCPTGRSFIIKVSKGTKEQLAAEGFSPLN